MSILKKIIFSKNNLDTWSDLLNFAKLESATSKTNVEMYGMGEILRQYCRLPRFFPLYVKSQHGVSLWEEAPPHELYAPEKYVFVFSKRWKDVFNSAGRKRVKAIGAPYLYYRKFILDREKKKIPALSAIFFLAHSTYWEKNIINETTLLKKLMDIRVKHKQLTVCVHFNDILNGNAQILFDNGFDIATAGNFYNLEFHINFYNLLLNHNNIYTNSVGSHVLYAIDLDKDVHWVDIDYTTINVAHDDDHWELVKQGKPLITEFRNELRVDGRISTKLRNMTSRELGADCLRSKLGILILILESLIYWWINRNLNFIKNKIKSKIKTKILSIKKLTKT